MELRVTFSGIKEIFFDSSTLVYICLFSPVFIYSLHLSSASAVFLEWTKLSNMSSHSRQNYD